MLPYFHNQNIPDELQEALRESPASRRLILTSDFSSLQVVHKTTNSLNSLPQTTKSQAKLVIHETWHAETKFNAESL